MVNDRPRWRSRHFAPGTERRAAAPLLPTTRRPRGRAAEAARDPHLRSDAAPGGNARRVRRAGHRRAARARGSPSCPRTTWATTTSGPPTAPSASTSPGTSRTRTLWRLVNDHLFEYTREEVLMYLRHEAGHAHQLRVRAVAPARLDADLRRLPPPVPRRLQPEPVEPRLRPLPAPRGHVPLRAEAPGRGLGRDVRRLAGGRATGGAATATGRSRFAKLEYVDRVVGIERACRGNPSNVRLGMRVPYTEIKETVAEYFDIGDDVDQDLLEYRKRPARDLRRAARRARAPSPRRGLTLAHRERPVGGALHPAAPEHPGRPHQPLDRRLRQARDPALPAPAAGALHRRAHGRPRQPPHREARRADRRRDLARRRRHPPTELARRLDRR